MKVNELRIGNLIYDNDGLLSIVTGFKPFDDLETCDEDEGCYVLNRFYTTEDKMLWGEFKIDSNDCKPIPLTEDVLLKCGFEIKPDSALPTFVYSGRLDLQVEFMLGKYSFRIEVENRHTTFVRVVDYLHQLQNLYFAITGEELKVEL